MGLSSNILWHQTKKEGFEGIINSMNLQFSYSKETMLYNKPIAIPMISMCDLPLSDIGEFLGKYGDFTIGFKRSWGVKNGFNPVWYCEPSSAIQKVLSHNDKEGLKELYAYIKPVEGELETHGYTYRNYRFYDEHEVRLVPTEDEMKKNGLKWILSEEEYTDYKAKHKGSPNTSLSIPFEIKDIRYLIVRSELHVQKYRDLFKNIPIFTQRQVKEDIIGTNHSFRYKTFDANSVLYQTLLHSYDNDPKRLEKQIAEKLAILGTFPLPKENNDLP